MPYCPNCGKEVPLGANFCEDCRAKAHAQPVNQTRLARILSREKRVGFLLDRVKKVEGTIRICKTVMEILGVLGVIFGTALCYGYWDTWIWIITVSSTAGVLLGLVLMGILDGKKELLWQKLYSLDVHERHSSYEE